MRAFRCDDGMHIEDYHHGEGLERCEVDDGLLCIIRDNLGSPNYYVSASSLPINRCAINGLTRII